MIEGIRVKDLKKFVDERGFFSEIMRDEWKDFLGDDKIQQLNLSLTYPGIIKAWHRHARGQNDYFIVLKGSIKLCAFDDREGSPTRGELAEIILNEESLQVARVIGACWHGYKVVGTKPSLVLYAVTKLYDNNNPDEERRPWDDPKIIPIAINGKVADVRAGKAYDWSFTLHK